MKVITLIAFTIYTISSNAQFFGTQEMIEENNINLKPWVEKNIENYSGLYSYGESEAESSIHLSISNNIICAQLENGDWVISNLEVTGWHKFYTNYTNVRIEGNRFYSDQSNGEFITFTFGNLIIKGLKLDTPPVQMGSEGDYEIGKLYKSENIGKYFNTKEEILSEKYLEKISLPELKIMRNEIFARYHYTFNTKRMLDYFAKQDWYSGYYNNVDSFLTEIEIENIRKIQAIENNNR